VLPAGTSIPGPRLFHSRPPTHDIPLSVDYLLCELTESTKSPHSTSRQPRPRVFRPPLPPYTVARSWRLGAAFRSACSAKSGSATPLSDRAIDPPSEKDLGARRCARYLFSFGCPLTWPIFRFETATAEGKMSEIGPPPNNKTMRRARTPSNAPQAGQNQERGDER